MAIAVEIPIFRVFWWALSVGSGRRGVGIRSGKKVGKSVYTCETLPSCYCREACFRYIRALLLSDADALQQISAVLWGKWAGSLARLAMGIAEKDTEKTKKKKIPALSLIHI